MKYYTVAVLNEHQTWQIDLCDRLDKSGIQVIRVPIHSHAFDISLNQFHDVDLVVNRSSPSANKRGHRASVLYTLQLITHFERLGIPVINGSQAYMLEISKARQYELFESLGLPIPRTLVVNSAERVLGAAAELGPPLILKPNIGGSGSGVKPFQKRMPTLAEAQDVLDASPDGVAIVQEFKKSDEKTTYRVQMLGEEHLYSLKAIGDGLNRCPNQRDCEPLETGSQQDCSPPDIEFEAHQEDPSILRDVRRIVKEGELDTCGVEYLISQGQLYYFDLNALSNIVRNPATVLGNIDDPTDRFVHFIQERLAQCKRPPTESDQLFATPPANYRG